MLRALVTAGFLLLAVLILWTAFIVGTDSSFGTLFINLGTEIIGIVITVAVRSASVKLRSRPAMSMLAANRSILVKMIRRR